MPEQNNEHVARIDIKLTGLNDLDNASKRLDALDERIKKSDNYFAELGKDISNLGRRFSSELGEIMSKFPEELSRHNGKTMLNSVVGDAKKANDEINNLIKSLSNVMKGDWKSDRLLGMDKEIDKAMSKIDKLNAQMMKLSKTTPAVGSEAWNKNEQSIVNLRARLKDLKSDMSKVQPDTQAYKDYDKEVNKVTRSIITLLSKRYDMKAQGNFTDTAEFSALNDEMTKATEELEELVDLKEALFHKDFDNAFTSSHDEFNGMADDIKARIDDLKSKISEANAVKDQFLNAGGAGETARETEKIGNEMRKFTSFNGIWGRFFPESVQNRALKLEDQIRRIYDQLNAMKGQTFVSAEYQRLENNISRISDKLTGMLLKQDQMRRSGVDTQSAAWRQLADRIEVAKAQLNDYMQRAQEMETNGTARVKGSDTQRYNDLKAKAGELSAEYDKVAGSGKAKAAAVFGSIASAITRGAQSGARKTEGIFSSMFKKIGSGIKSVIKHFRDWRKEHKLIQLNADRMYKTFFSYLRMMRNRLRRTLVGLMFNDAKERLHEIAAFSPRFNNAMSSMILSLKTLGAQLIASIEPFVAAISPIVTLVVDKLTVAAQRLSQLIASVSGSDTWLRAKKGQYDYAKSVDKSASSTKKATKAAKEYEATVLSFDELHKLNGDKGDTDESVDFAFDEVEYDRMTTLLSRLWQAIHDHDWKSAGAILGDAMNEAFGWLGKVFGWSNNGEKITNFLAGLKDVINNFIASMDSEEIGSIIADIITTPIEIFANLLDPDSGIDFATLGNKIGATLGKAVDKIDWKKLGSTIIYGIRAALITAKGVIGGFEGLGTAISEIFEGMVDAFNPEEASDILSTVINTFFRIVGDMFGNQEKVTELGKKLAETVNKTLKKINTADVADGISNLAATFTNIIKSFLFSIDWGGILKTLTGILTQLDWGSVGGAIAVIAMPKLLKRLFGGGGGLLSLLLGGGGGGKGALGGGRGFLGLSAGRTTLFKGLLTLAGIGIATGIKEGLKDDTSIGWAFNYGLNGMDNATGEASRYVSGINGELVEMNRRGVDTNSALWKGASVLGTIQDNLTTIITALGYEGGPKQYVEDVENSDMRQADKNRFAHNAAADFLSGNWNAGLDDKGQQIFLEAMETIADLDVNDAEAWQNGNIYDLDTKRADYFARAFMNYLPSGLGGYSEDERYDIAYNMFFDYLNKYKESMPDEYVIPYETFYNQYKDIEDPAERKKAADDAFYSQDKEYNALMYNSRTLFPEQIWHGQYAELYDKIREENPYISFDEMKTTWIEAVRDTFGTDSQGRKLLPDAYADDMWEDFAGARGLTPDDFNDGMWAIETVVRDIYNRGENEDVVSNAHTDTFIDKMTENIRGIIMSAVASMQNSEGNADVHVYLDCEDVARAAIKGDRKINKRNNPVVQLY